MHRKSNMDKVVNLNLFITLLLGFKPSVSFPICVNVVRVDNHVAKIVMNVNINLHINSDHTLMAYEHDT